MSAEPESLDASYPSSLSSDVPALSFFSNEVSASALAALPLSSPPPPSLSSRPNSASGSPNAPPATGAAIIAPMSAPVSPAAFAAFLEVEGTGASDGYSSSSSLFGGAPIASASHSAAVPALTLPPVAAVAARPPAAPQPELVSFEAVRRTGTPPRLPEAKGVEIPVAVPVFCAELDLATVRVARSVHRAGQSNVRAGRYSSPPFDYQDLMLDTDMRGFLTSPCPQQASTIQCCVRRHRSGMSKLFPTISYSLFMSEDNRFLMCATRIKDEYVISMQRDDFNESSANLLGAVRRCDFFGSEYRMYDAGRAPLAEVARAELGGGESSSQRQELGCVLFGSTSSVRGYSSHVLTKQAPAPRIFRSGPRTMQVYIIESTGRQNSVQRNSSESDETTTNSNARAPGAAAVNFASLVNCQPRWNEQVQAFVLNFSGRVTMASVKNFQLVDRDRTGPEDIILQFGRIGKEEFTMDFKFPMTPLQAFSVALATFDTRM